MCSLSSGLVIQLERRNISTAGPLFLFPLWPGEVDLDRTGKNCPSLDLTAVSECGKGIEAVCRGTLTAYGNALKNNNKKRRWTTIRHRRSFCAVRCDNEPKNWNNERGASRFCMRVCLLFVCRNKVATAHDVGR